MTAAAATRSAVAGHHLQRPHASETKNELTVETMFLDDDELQEIKELSYKLVPLLQAVEALFQGVSLEFRLESKTADSLLKQRCCHCISGSLQHDGSNTAPPFSALDIAWLKSLVDNQQRPESSASAAAEPSEGQTSLRITSALSTSAAVDMDGSSSKENFNNNSLDQLDQEDFRSSKQLFFKREEAVPSPRILQQAMGSDPYGYYNEEPESQGGDVDEEEPPIDIVGKRVMEQLLAKQQEDVPAAAAAMPNLQAMDTDPYGYPAQDHEEEDGSSSSSAVDIIGHRVMEQLLAQQQAERQPLAAAEPDDGAFERASQMLDSLLGPFVAANSDKENVAMTQPDPAMVIVTVEETIAAEVPSELSVAAAFDDAPTDKVLDKTEDDVVTARGEGLFFLPHRLDGPIDPRPQLDGMDLSEASLDHDTNALSAQYVLKQLIPSPLEPMEPSAQLGGTKVGGEVEDDGDGGGWLGEKARYALQQLLPLPKGRLEPTAPLEEDGSSSEFVLPIDDPSSKARYALQQLLPMPASLNEPRLRIDGLDLSESEEEEPASTSRMLEPKTRLDGVDLSENELLEHDLRQSLYLLDMLLPMPAENKTDREPQPQLNGLEGMPAPSSTSTTREPTAQLNGLDLFTESSDGDDDRLLEARYILDLLLPPSGPSMEPDREMNGSRVETAPSSGDESSQRPLEPVPRFQGQEVSANALEAQSLLEEKRNEARYFVEQLDLAVAPAVPVDPTPQFGGMDQERAFEPGDNRDYVNEVRYILDLLLLHPELARLDPEGHDQCEADPKLGTVEAVGDSLDREGFSASLCTDPMTERAHGRGIEPVQQMNGIGTPMGADMSGSKEERLREALFTLDLLLPMPMAPGGDPPTESMSALGRLGDVDFRPLVEPRPATTELDRAKRVLDLLSTVISAGEPILQAPHDSASAAPSVLDVPVTLQADAGPHETAVRGPIDPPKNLHGHEVVTQSSQDYRDRLTAMDPPPLHDGLELEDPTEGDDEDDHNSLEAQATLELLLPPVMKLRQDLEADGRAFSTLDPGEEKRSEARHLLKALLPSPMEGYRADPPLSLRGGLVQNDEARQSNDEARYIVDLLLPDVGRGLEPTAEILEAEKDDDLLVQDALYALDRLLPMPLSNIEPEGDQRSGTGNSDHDGHARYTVGLLLQPWLSESTDASQQIDGVFQESFGIEDDEALLETQRTLRLLLPFPLDQADPQAAEPDSEEHHVGERVQEALHCISSLLPMTRAQLDPEHSILDFPSESRSFDQRSLEPPGQLDAFDLSVVQSAEQKLREISYFLALLLPSPRSFEEPYQELSGSERVEAPSDQDGSDALDAQDVIDLLLPLPQRTNIEPLPILKDELFDPRSVVDGYEQHLERERSYAAAKAVELLLPMLPLSTVVQILDPPASLGFRHGMTTIEIEGSPAATPPTMEEAVSNSARPGVTHAVLTRQADEEWDLMPSIGIARLDGIIQVQDEDEEGFVSAVQSAEVSVADSAIDEDALPVHVQPTTVDRDNDDDDEEVLEQAPVSPVSEDDEIWETEKSDLQLIPVSAPEVEPETVAESQADIAAEVCEENTVDATEEQLPAADQHAALAVSSMPDKANQEREKETTLETESASSSRVQEAAELNPLNREFAGLAQVEEVAEAEPVDSEADVKTERLHQSSVVLETKEATSFRADSVEQGTAGEVPEAGRVDSTADDVETTVVHEASESTELAVQEEMDKADGADVDSIEEMAAEDRKPNEVMDDTQKPQPEQRTASLSISGFFSFAADHVADAPQEPEAEAVSPEHEVIVEEDEEAGEEIIEEKYEEEPLVLVNQSAMSRRLASSSRQSSSQRASWNLFGGIVANFFMAEQKAIDASLESEQTRAARVIQRAARQAIARQCLSEIRDRKSAAAAAAGGASTASTRTVDSSFFTANASSSSSSSQPVVVVSDASTADVANKKKSAATAQEAAAPIASVKFRSSSTAAKASSDDTVSGHTLATEAETTTTTRDESEVAVRQVHGGGDHSLSESDEAAIHALVGRTASASAKSRTTATSRATGFFRASFAAEELPTTAKVKREKSSSKQKSQASGMLGDSRVAQIERPSPVPPPPATPEEEGATTVRRGTWSLFGGMFSNLASEEAQDAVEQVATRKNDDSEKSSRKRRAARRIQRALREARNEEGQLIMSPSQ